jgi:hypothetical protein
MGPLLRPNPGHHEPVGGEGGASACTEMGCSGVVGGVGAVSGKRCTVVLLPQVAAAALRRVAFTEMEGESEDDTSSPASTPI